MSADRAVGMRHLTVSSRLGVAPERFWDNQSIATVNAELGPWIRMSAPAAWRDLRLKDWGPSGDRKGRLFRSWVLLLGIFPLDRHAFGTLDLGDGLRFVERSSSWFARTWRHERSARAVPGGCEVVDRVGFDARLRWLSPVLAFTYTAVFRHRHARLRTMHPVA